MHMAFRKMNANSKHRSALREKIREVTRDAILDAAETAFVKHGLHVARMEDVASAAGVAVGTIYNHVGDRDSLFAAIVERRRKDFLAALDASLREGAGAPFDERLSAFARATLEQAASYRPLVTLLMESGATAGAWGKLRRAFIQEILSRAQRLVRDGVAAGALDPSGEALYPALLIGMIRGLMSLSTKGDGAPAAEAAAQGLSRVFLRGAGAGP
jgi:AcrR family transcriptional regulator